MIEESAHQNQAMAASAAQYPPSSFENQVEDMAAAKSGSLYDLAAPQRVTIEVEDEDSRYQTTYRFEGFDELLPEYDRMRELLIESKGKEQSFITNSLEADCWLFDEIAKEVADYEGELPADWKSCVSPEEKQAAISQLLSVSEVENDQVKTLKKRSFSNVASIGKTVRLNAYFDLREVETEITLKAKTTKETAEYQRITTKLGLGKNATKLSPSLAAKARLGRKMLLSCKGYEGGNIPMHHLALAVTIHFDKSVTAIEKK